MLPTLQKYDLNIRYYRGKSIPVADTLSRTPCSSQYSKEEESLEELVHTDIEHIPIIDQLLLKVKEEYKSDEEMCNLKDMIQNRLAENQT